MAQTFKDFILECELYDHSQQKFELMKECSELELTEKYLNDQIFMAENAALIKERCGGLEEGFFQESVGESTFEVMTEKYFEKKKGVMGKIMRGLERIIEVFKNFIRKIANKFDDTTSKGQSVRKRLAKAKLEEADIKKMKEIVDSVKAKDGSNFPVMANQPYLSKVKLGSYASTDATVSALTNDIAAALSDSVVVASVTMNKEGTAVDMDKIGALPAETIKEAAFRVKNGDLPDLKGVLATITSSWKTVHSSGLKIKVNTNEINKLVEDLNQISTAIAEVGRGEATKAAAGGAAIKAAAEKISGQEVPFEGTELAKVAEEATSKLTAAIGQTMKLYSSLNGYRTGVINGLDAMLAKE